MKAYPHRWLPAGLVATIAGLWLLGIFVLVPFSLPKRVEAGVRNACECDFRLTGLRISPLLHWVEFSDVRFGSNPRLATRVVANVERLRLYPSWWRLLRKEFLLHEVQAVGPFVTVTDGDEPQVGSGVPDVPAEKNDEKTGWAFGVRATDLRSGSFRYESISGKKRALVTIRGINGSVGGWHSQPGASAAETVGAVTGTLERSGGFELRVAAPIFARETRVNVDLKIEGLNLAELDSYFGPSEALALKGVLRYGRAVVEVKERDLQAWVRTRYDGLAVSFGANRERGVLDAALSNLGASIAVDPTVTAETADALRQTRGVSLKQRPRESIVSFILRGMKDAALRVATGS